MREILLLRESMTSYLPLDTSEITLLIKEVLEALYVFEREVWRVEVTKNPKFSVE